MQDKPGNQKEAESIPLNDEMSEEELDKIDGGTGKGLDSKSDMGEITSQRLQMTMERKSKFISTLSNIQSKISQTGDTITQNIK